MGFEAPFDELRMKKSGILRRYYGDLLCRRAATSDKLKPLLEDHIAGPKLLWKC
jgi:hypothetical protein